jgi:cytochrome b6-f complex iron-sulfur subunit
MIGAFWTSVAGLVAAAGVSIANTMYPRGVGGFGGPVAVPASAIPRPGDPPRPNLDGRFLLVNLAPGEGLAVDGSAETAGGLLALWRRCPHLGCTVPWNESYRWKDGRKGWFVCPCHGSTYSKAGLRVDGPAPRSMDTMRIEVTDAGIVVQTGDRTKGDTDNAQRVVPWRT